MKSRILDFGAVRRNDLRKTVDRLTLALKEADYFTEERVISLYKSTKDGISNLLNSSPNNIALLPSAYLGHVLIANSIPFSRRSRILIPSIEPAYLKNIWIKQRDKGFDVDVFENKGFNVSLESLLKHLSDDTLLVPFMHVYFTTGYKNDVCTLSRYLFEAGAMSLVDASFSLGALKIDVSRCNVDILISGCDKWLNSTSSIGIVYLSDRARRTVKAPFPTGLLNFDDDPSILLSYYDLDILGLLLLKNSIEEIIKIGIEKIENRILSLTGWLIEELTNSLGLEVITPYERNLRGGIVSVNLGDKAQYVKHELYKRNIVVSSYGNLLQISIHYTHEEEDISLFLSNLKSCLSAV